jgi:superfamily II DNA or RNA helicase
MPDAKVGVIQGERCEYEGCDFVIGMMQSLANGATDKYPFGMFSSFGLVISDEVHRIGAKTWANVISLFSARYRVGLTATPRRKDKCEDVFWHHIGPILYTAKTEAMTPVVSTVETEFRLAPVMKRGHWIDPENLTPVDVVTQLVSDLARNRQIAEVVCSHVANGRKVMVVSERLEHLRALSANISSVLRAYTDLSFEPRIDYYTGEWFSGGIDSKTGTQKRKARTEEDRDQAESANVIMATRQIMEEGLDISSVDVLVLATPIADVEQAVGRARRFCTPSPGKCERLCPWRAGKCESKPTPIVIDVVDVKVRRIARKFEERKLFYDRIGSEINDQQRILRKMVSGEQRAAS